MPDSEQESNTTFSVVCTRYGGDPVEYENEQAAIDDGWRKSEDGDWYSPEAMNNGCFCSICHDYVDLDHEDYLCDIDGDGDTYHRECALDANAFYCNRCDQWHWTENYSEERVLIHWNNYDSPDEEYWCDECARDEAIWDDQDEVYRFYPRPRQQQQLPRNVVAHPEGWEDVNLISPQTMSPTEYVAKVAATDKKNKELEETTLWVYDDRASTGGFYHPREHCEFKKKFFREKHEHPNLYYGLEVEVSFDMKKIARPITDIASEFVHKVKGMCVCESDSSLMDEQRRNIIGVEFIFRPISYKRLTNPETITLLKEGFKFLVEQGAYVNQPITNGIHIHLSRKFFECRTTKSTDQINKDMDWVFQYFQEEIEKISQRNYTRFCYSKLDNLKDYLAGSQLMTRSQTLKNFKISGEIQPSYIVSGQTEHHAAITMRENTIEVRCFKSSVDVDTIISYVEFVRNIAHTVRNKKIKDMTLQDILGSKQSPHLDQYIWNLKRHGGLSTDRKVKDKLKYQIKQSELADRLMNQF